MVILSNSAVRSPMSRLYSRLMCWVIASSILSPPTRTLFAQTMPARLITATSDVPPPMSTIMLPEGSVMGRPAPMAAAMGCSIRNHVRMARRQVPVAARPNRVRVRP